MHGLRIIVAFLVAPLIPGMVVVLLPGAGGNFGVLAGFLSGAIVLAPYTYVATLIFGIPAFVMYRRFHLVGVTHYLVGGFLGPVVVFLVFGALVHDATPMQWLVAGAWFGLITFPATVLFWVIAIWQPRWRAPSAERSSNPRLQRSAAGGDVDPPEHDDGASDGRQPWL